MDHKNEYGLIDSSIIFQYSIPKSVNNYNIFARAFPTNPLHGIKFHTVDDTEDMKSIAPLIIKEETCGTDNIFIIDLKEEYIGNYFFAGLVVDSMTEFAKFISDVKTSNVTIGIVNIDKTYRLDTIGILVEELTTLCGASTTPTIHIFIPKSSASTIVENINTVMKEYFVRMDGETA